MYSEEIKVFLELLRAGLWGRRPDVPQDFDQWEKVASIAGGQSVFPIIGMMLLTDPDISPNISQDLRFRVRKLTFSHINSHTLIDKTLVTVVTALREKGIESVLLKGQALARNYPQPELRQCGDIDLYVGCENSRKTHEVLAPLAVSIDNVKMADHGKHYDVTMEGGVSVEVHRYTDIHVSKRLRSVYQAASDKGVSDNIIAMDFAGTKVNTLADDFNAFYIFNHLFQHFMVSGVGLRQLCDLMMFLHTRKDFIDRESLGQLLNKMDMMTPWQAFGCVLVQELGLPEDEFPFYDKAQEGKERRILARVLEEGNFGKERSLYKKRGTVYLIKKTIALITYLARTVSISFLFPKHTAQYFMSHMFNGFERVWADLKVKFNIK